MYFALMHRRLVEHLRGMVRSGEMTERGLARLAGVSQPHLHNVLKGVRVLSTEMADQVVAHLHLGALDLLASELGRAPFPAAWEPRYTEVPVLAGCLGPSHPFPSLEDCQGTLPFLRTELTGIAHPLGVRLAADRQAGHLFHAHDIALLAPFPDNRQSLAGDPYYAIDAGGSSLIRRVERRGDLLFLKPEDERDPPGCILLADRNILEVVRARVIWIGRYLERSPIADRPFEEAGPEHRPPAGKG